MIITNRNRILCVCARVSVSQLRASLWHTRDVSAFRLHCTSREWVMKCVLTVDSHFRRVTDFSHAIGRCAPVDPAVFNLNVADVYVTDDVTMKRYVLTNNEPAEKKNADQRKSLSLQRLELWPIAVPTALSLLWKCVYKTLYKFRHHVEIIH